MSSFSGTHDPAPNDPVSHDPVQIPPSAHQAALLAKATRTGNRYRMHVEEAELYATLLEEFDVTLPPTATAVDMLRMLQRLLWPLGWLRQHDRHREHLLWRRRWLLQHHR